MTKNSRNSINYNFRKSNTNETVLKVLYKGFLIFKYIYRSKVLTHFYNVHGQRCVECQNA